MNPKAHAFTFSTCFAFSFWHKEERNYKGNYTLSKAKDFIVFLENTVYRIACHWSWPSICIICIFRIPIVFTRAKDWLPVSNSDLLNQSFHPLHSDDFALLVWSLRLCSLSVSSQQRFCHGSYKWAYGRNGLLGIRSCSIRTCHISRLDEGWFLVDNCNVKHSIWNYTFSSMKMCSFLCKAMGIPNSLPRLEMHTPVCGRPKMPVCYGIFLDFILINTMLQCIHLSMY